MQKILVLLFFALTMTATVAFAGGNGPPAVRGPNADIPVSPYICTLTVGSDRFSVFIKEADSQQTLCGTRCESMETTSTSNTYTCEISSWTQKSFFIKVDYTYSKGGSKADVCKWFVNKYTEVK